jgi:DNA-3-methyladenine glycosylase II
MMHTLPTRKPFAFAQTLTFMRRFPACAAEACFGPDRVTAALAIGARAHAFTLREQRGNVVLEVADDAPIDAIAERVAGVIGARDDLRGFYAAAEGDPCFAPIVRALHGLHHVRFVGGLAEIAVYSVMMQRAPIAQAVRLKSKFLDRFGVTVQVEGRTLRAMPELRDLAVLDEEDIASAIGHRTKGARIASVVRGVAALGESFLRDAAYAQARDALLAIDGVGPFSAGAILLRGLGRMDELPSFEMFEREGRAVYRHAWKPEQIAKRYADQIGYWSFYLKTGAARMQLKAA